MRRTIFLIVGLLVFDSYTADICQEERVVYKTGKLENILDIDSEDISRLQQACYKQFNIPGSVNATLFVEEIFPGGNKYFKYGSLGMTSVFSRDKILVSKYSCPKSLQDDTKHWEELVQPGQGVSLTDVTVFCLKFQPSQEGRNLGSHIRGNRVRLLLKVGVAFCENAGTTTSVTPHDFGRTDSGKCRELCNATGVIAKCTNFETIRHTTTPAESSTSEPSSKFIPTSTLSSETAALISILSSLTSVEPLKTSSVSTNRATETTKTSFSVSPFAKTTDLIRFNYTVSSLSLSTKNSASSIRTSTWPPVTHPNYSFTKETHYGNTASERTKDHSMKWSTKSWYDPMSTHSIISKTKEPQDGSATVTNRTADVATEIGLVGSGSTKTNIAGISYKSTTETNNAIETTLSISRSSQGVSGEDAMEGGELFGLMNGLYVLVGCILTVLLIVIVSCCILRIRKYRLHNHAGQDCHTVSSLQTQTCSESGDMPWRDNWLVRHHSTQPHQTHDEDTFSQSEKDFQMIHGNFVHQSNPELHLIHSECSDSIQQSETIYDNAHYLLKLNKDELDKKVKDVIIKQRLQSISSNDSEKTIEIRRVKTASESSVYSIAANDDTERQRVSSIASCESNRANIRRVKRLSESSMTSVPDSDVFQYSYTNQEDQGRRYTRKCHRSNSSVDDNNLRNERIARIQGRRRTISQTSKPELDLEDNTGTRNPKTNDLENASSRSRTGSKSSSLNNIVTTEHNTDLGASTPNKGGNDSHQGVVKEETAEYVSSNNLQRENDTTWTVSALYALVSQQNGASGTVQFKK